jgi:hypothetical protein
LQRPPIFFVLLVVFVDKDRDKDTDEDAAEARGAPGQFLWRAAGLGGFSR